MAKRVDAPLSWQADQFQDLSGTSSSTQKFDNPYDVLIHGSNNDAALIQERYSNHRTGRNQQQRAKLLSNDFAGVSVDPVLYNLVNDSSYKDPRYCLVFWARPTQHVKNLIKQIQDMIAADFPKLWFMPQTCLHMTTLEITHSRTEADVAQLVDGILPGVTELTDYTFDHRARLIKPLMSFDASAFALSFIPAAGENLSDGRTASDDKYTYHHLRRDVYNLSKKLVDVDSRYTVPSSHLTVGRFIDKDAFSTAEGTPDAEKMKKLVQKFDEINDWLQREYWPTSDGRIKEGGEWIVGQTQGLDFRRGTLWYGGGASVRLGKGF
ncbi:hypothetical protein EJ05DRAFT_475082 [Pseudovirgaria hyperparasitica]|uniref:RNA ligase/cyclic nucleotide phosphodiesterase n=1 Tax=Pseudovirgaria hyperparasitica TaxID=470096 RepID=A0A6A6WBV9_9PEZI|nr:uncharacterized protein EJ05DRAFT_475082 [Pseudovirgaria hyperparasitica]KAF2760065.1 hypothetical protein EJ05DRAFT_475082 [Pseudovirgaria hyperparasitica]